MSKPREARCHRLIQGHSKECPTEFGMMDLQLWCPVCLEAYDRWCDEQAEQAELDDRAESLPPSVMPQEPPPPPATGGPPPYLCPQCGTWHAGSCQLCLYMWLSEAEGFCYDEVYKRSPN
jgi:hypothetical protein